MKIPNLKDFLDAGVHFGHQTRRWNPMMKPFVYMEKGGIHIINLKKSLAMCQKAIEFVRKTAAEGGKMIFVGTKKQATQPVKTAAQRCAQFYVTKRWLGGMLTNFITIKSSVDRLKKIDQMREKGDLDLLSKKEKSRIEKERYQLNEYLNGIREMKENPALIFVVDIVKERIAVKEAKKLNIPVVGIADTNCNPKEIDFPIPGNDDSIRSITLFSEMIADAYIEGEKEWKEKLKTEELLHEKEKSISDSVSTDINELKKDPNLKSPKKKNENKKSKTSSSLSPIEKEHHQSAEKMSSSTAQRKGKLSSKEYKEKLISKKSKSSPSSLLNKQSKTAHGIEMTQKNKNQTKEKAKSSSRMINKPSNQQSTTHHESTHHESTHHESTHQASSSPSSKSGASPQMAKRKFVAAGLAEEVEIEMELKKEKEKKTLSNQNEFKSPDSSDTKSKLKTKNKSKNEFPEKK